MYIETLFKVTVPAPYLDHKKVLTNFVKNHAFLMFIEATLCLETCLFFIPFYYGSGSSFGSSSGSVPVQLRQKVTVPTVSVPVPQHCITSYSFVLLSTGSMTFKLYTSFFCPEVFEP